MSSKQQAPETGLIVSIRDSWFRVIESDGERFILEIYKGQIFPATTEEIDEAIASNAIPDSWSSFGTLSFDVTLDSYTSLAGVSKLSLEDGVWKRAEKGSAIYSRGIDAIVCRFFDYPFPKGSVIDVAALVGAAPDAAQIAAAADPEKSRYLLKWLEWWQKKSGVSFSGELPSETFLLQRIKDSISLAEKRARRGELVGVAQETVPV
ncbi:MAG TPA: hypothetical protein VFT82_01805 [Candidatus Paceibacterota bacterium]|nr:hypothetical protein [Candidatus Paceibacterota bacterium]